MLRPYSSSVWRATWSLAVTTYSSSKWLLGWNFSWCASSRTARP
ncbi:hypothetical protein [Streptomyces sp. enrichment culture]